MPNVRNIIKSAIGVPVPNVLVTIELGTVNDAGAFTQNLGFIDIDPNSTSDYSVDYTIDTAGFTSTNASGVWEVTLYPNEDILNPAGSIYRITETYQGTSRIYYINVPSDDPSPNTAYWVGQILDNTPVVLGSTISLDDLSDVDPNLDPDDFQALIWDGTKWTAGSVAVGGSVIPGEPTEDAIPNYPQSSSHPDNALFYPLEHVDDTRPGLPGYHSKDHEQMRVEIIAIEDDLIAARGGIESPFGNLAAKIEDIDLTLDAVISAASVFYSTNSDATPFFHNEPPTISTKTEWFDLLDTGIFIPAGSMLIGDKLDLHFDVIVKNYLSNMTFSWQFRLDVIDDPLFPFELLSPSFSQSTSANDFYRLISTDFSMIATDSGLRFSIDGRHLGQGAEIGPDTNSWDNVAGSGNALGSTSQGGSGIFGVDYENNDTNIMFLGQMGYNIINVSYPSGSKCDLQLTNAWATLTRAAVLE
jgi:hypothetical protein